METNKGAFLRIMMRLERREIQKMGPHKNDDEAIQEGAQRKRDQTMGTLLRMPMRLVRREPHKREETTPTNNANEAC